MSKETIKMALDELKHIKQWCLRSLGIGLVNENVLAVLEEALNHSEDTLDMVKQEGQSNFCPNCEALSRELKAIKQEQDEPVAHIGKTQFERLKDCGLVTTSLTSHKAFEDDIALYTTPQPAQKPLTDEQRRKIAARWRDGNGTASEIIDMVEDAHGIKENT